jgi:dTDP-4-amino-4,6-dideoxygalactose transaminase
MKIPLSVPDVDRNEADALTRVLMSGWLTDGPANMEFEQLFAAYLGVKRAVTLNSCTSALQLALEAQSITGEVILPSFTFVASANAVVKAGATPVFADIDYGTCNISPEQILQRITPRTEAIMVVHFAGQCCRMDEIMAIAREHGLQVIEDSAETLGGTFMGKMTGSFATGCFSFFPTKNITTGEGGMLTTDDDDLAEKVKALAGHGIVKGTFRREQEMEPWHREASMAGYNCRMSGLLAAIGVEQMKKLPAMNERRRANAAYLSERLDFDEIDLPVEDRDCRHVFQMYTVKVRGVDRRDFVLGLREEGVMASVHFSPPLHKQAFYAERYGTAPGVLPVTEQVAATIVTLPMYPQLTNGQLDYMVAAVEKVLVRLKGSPRRRK